MGNRGSLGGGARVSFAADAMLAAIFRVALKAFGERARNITLPGPGFRQVQLNADFLRQVCEFIAVHHPLNSLDCFLSTRHASACVSVEFVVFSVCLFFLSTAPAGSWITYLVRVQTISRCTWHGYRLQDLPSMVQLS